MIKKADVILAVLLIAVGLIISYVFSFGREAGSKVEVYSDGELYGIYSMTEEQEISVKTDGHINIIVISDGYVYMKDSDCNGHDCIEQGKIYKTGQNIVCLPNKVVIKITGGSSELDAVAR